LYSVLQAQKSCARVKAEMHNVVNIMESIGISDIENDSLVENITDKAQNNISTLHNVSEELTSKNVSLKVELEKTKHLMDSSEVNIY
jgi:hypothetical protein